jgi:hypothetical protein
MSFKQFVRQVAQQFTLLGLTENPVTFSESWLGGPKLYDRIAKLDPIELSQAIQCLDLSMEIQEWSYHYAFAQAETEQDRWMANVRLATLRGLMRQFRNWKIIVGWREQ